MKVSGTSSVRPLSNENSARSSLSSGTSARGAIPRIWARSIGSITACHCLSDRCIFQTVEVGPLPFDDHSFDVVISSGAFTQIADKSGILGESFRLLRPGGHLRCYDWLKPEGDEYSEDMLYWFRVEGLTYALETLESYAQHFENVCFVDVASEDASDWYRKQVHLEYDLLKGELYPRMVELLGQADADHFVENWRAAVIVIDKGEMRQGYSRGRRPA